MIRQTQSPLDFDAPLTTISAEKPSPNEPTQPRWPCQGNPTRRLTNTWANWIHKFAPWTHAVTLTCKRRVGGGSPISEPALLDIARHFLQRINYKCFRRRAKRGQSVACVACYGWGSYGDHPHLHFSLTAPSTMTYEEFSALIEQAANAIALVGKQRAVKPYQNQGWPKYIVEHGTDHLIEDLLRPPRPS
jgi:hypothetical protein